jgi:hypothetical protein
MSNVLIGIIGVILFIGLALAGALFLGPRFQDSTQNSKASAAVQAVSQVSSAANLYRTQEGGTLLTGNLDVLKNGGYLKSVPSNPIGTADILLGQSPTTLGSGNPALFVTMDIPLSAKSTCLAIVRQTSGQTPANPLVEGDAGSMTAPAGCVADAGTATRYVVYSRI